MALIARTDKTVLQNVLMRIPDKVCAAALATITEDQRAPMYSIIAESKAARIREEIRLESRRRTSPAVRMKLIAGFFSFFESGPRPRVRPYIKPIRPEQRRRGKRG
jgi:hypothetical protein